MRNRLKPAVNKCQSTGHNNKQSRTGKAEIQKSDKYTTQQNRCCTFRPSDRWAAYTTLKNPFPNHLRIVYECRSWHRSLIGFPSSPLGKRRLFRPFSLPVNKETAKINDDIVTLIFFVGTCNCTCRPFRFVSRLSKASWQVISWFVNIFVSPHQQTVLQSTTFRPGCPSHFQVSNRKRKCQPF